MKDRIPRHALRLILALVAAAPSLAAAQQAGPGAEGRQPARMTWDIDGLRREALVFLPAGEGDAFRPVVFGFHGHGGTARNASRSFGLQRHWPEAIVVYMQGVPTPGRLTDPEGRRNGWQHDVGDHGDRDVKFFDAVLDSLLEKHRGDPERVYAMGHSNGAAFTYVLWAARGERFAALAPSAGGSRSIRLLKPRPAFHLAGEADELVRIEGQRRVIEAVKRINGCEADGKEWAPGCLLYPSAGGTPLVTFIHPGGHAFPREAPELIVRFFKEHRRPPAERK
jgi:polyhydroxybutyrate depolymerase